MLLKKKINNWFKHFQQYFFTYKDGFFELSYLYNTPETLLGSLKKMPFNYHFPKKNLIRTSNPFVKGILQYSNLEEGLWITVTELNYKQNLTFKSIYDDDIESDYFCLSFNIAETKISKNTYELKNLSVTNTAWVLLKPMAVNNATCFKDNHIFYYSIYIHKNWLTKNIVSNSNLNVSQIKAFIEDTTVNCKMWPDNSNSPHKIVAPVQSVFDNLKETNELNILKLRIETMQLIVHFFDKVFIENDGINIYALPSKDRIKMMQVESYLLANLTDKFIGIDALATQFSISPTKLKNDFKNIFGMSIFSYFQSKQLELAYEYLQNENYRINEIVAILKYESASNFTAIFKKKYGFLPSAV